MEFQSPRMLSLLEHDPFLKETFLLTKKRLSEREALELIFHTFVVPEPMLKNAYDYLTMDHNEA